VKKKTGKEEAIKVADAIILSAIDESHKDLELAKRQADLARKVSLRFNLRLGYPLKRFTCHGCKSLIVPGVNARVRLQPGKSMKLLITCLECGRVNRKLLRHA
jgi:ribonuclease P protein subunit RPR2